MFLLLLILQPQLRYLLRRMCRLALSLASLIGGGELLGVFDQVRLRLWLAPSLAPSLSVITMIDLRDGDDVGFDSVLRLFVGGSVCVLALLNWGFSACLVAGVEGRREEKVRLPWSPLESPLEYPGSESVEDMRPLVSPWYSSASLPIEPSACSESLRSAFSSPKTCFAFVR